MTEFAKLFAKVPQFEVNAVFGYIRSHRKNMDQHIPEYLIHIVFVFYSIFISFNVSKLSDPNHVKLSKYSRAIENMTKKSKTIPFGDVINGRKFRKIRYSLKWINACCSFEIGYIAQKAIATFDYDNALSCGGNCSFSMMINKYCKYTIQNEGDSNIKSVHPKEGDVFAIELDFIRMKCYIHHNGLMIGVLAIKSKRLQCAISWKSHGEKLEIIQAEFDLNN